MSNEEDPLKIIKYRYAKGEISKKQFEELKKGILSSHNSEAESNDRLLHHKITSKQKIQTHKHFDEISIFGRFKPRFFIIIGIIIAAILAFYLLSAASTPNHISTYLNVVPIIGNGKSSYQIPLTIYNNLGTPMGDVHVQASTNKGSVSGCTTNSSGTCEIIFIPPKQATSSYANISLSVGSITKIISLRINPDPTAKITLTSTNTNLPADGSSSTVITINAYDNQASPVPDGTQITLSLSGGGSLSSTTCSTINGECRVTYTASTFPGNVTISALSYNATSSISITLLPLPPSSISLYSSHSSIIGNGHSTAIITAKVTNKLGNPVENVYLSFYTNEGNINNSCITDSFGECSVIYTSPNRAGTATINAYITQNSTISSSIPIALIGVSNITITSFYEAPYIGGNPTIVPAFAINYQYLNQSMVTLQVVNTGSATFTGQISVSIPNWSNIQTQYVSIPPQSSQTLYFDPQLNSQALSNNQARSVSYLLTVQNSNGAIVYQNSYNTTLASFNTMDWLGGKYDNLIAAWVQPTATLVHQLISNAATSLPGQAMVGYSTYSSGCGFLGLSACNVSQTTNLQLQAIYNQLQSENMHYVDAPIDFSGEQTVYTPIQSLSSGGANCIDGTLVFASAAVAIGLKTYIALVPGHAFVCVQATPYGNSVDCIETTEVGSGYSFSQAESEGDYEFSMYQQEGALNLIDVNQVLSSGVKELPSN